MAARIERRQMTTPYLPKVATLEQAQAWLEHETGQQWPLARLIEETRIMPWVWIDSTPEHPEIFAGRLEGFLAPMLFAGDTQRLAAGAEDIFMTMTETPEGHHVLPPYGLHCPLSQLRFLADDLRENARVANKPAPAVPNCEPIKGPRVTKSELIDGLDLTGGTWKERLRVPRKGIDHYKPARLDRGRQGQKTGSESTWNPVIFTRIAVELKHLNKTGATLKFKDAWPQWQDELEAEMGGIFP